MHLLNNFALIFTLLMNANARPVGLQDSSIHVVRPEKHYLSILLSPEGLSNPEGHSIKARNFKRLYKTNSISIKLDSGWQTILEYKAVWSYEDDNGAIYRNYNYDS